MDDDLFVVFNEPRRPAKLVATSLEELGAPGETEFDGFYIDSTPLPSGTEDSSAEVEGWSQFQPILWEDGHRLTVITILSTQPLGLQEEEAMSWAHLFEIPDGVLKGQVVPTEIDAKRSTGPILNPCMDDSIFQCEAQRGMDIRELVAILQEVHFRIGCASLLFEVLQPVRPAAACTLVGQPFNHLVLGQLIRDEAIRGPDRCQLRQ